jgi:uncharacterized protein RhaS with RHS repeats
LDPEIGLYYYRTRQHAPGLGRFLQPDPISFSRDSNLYAYTRNDPLNYTDPNGADNVPIEKDPNVALVQDRDIGTLSRNARHQLGVEATIQEYQTKGFQILSSTPLAVDVPGFDTPRFYDFLVIDPVTSMVHGIEVKTTIGDTIQLDRSQVAKDAIVATLGGTIRTTGQLVTAVGYNTYCFGCSLVDVRSKALKSVLTSAGIGVQTGGRPGEINPR